MKRVLEPERIKKPEESINEALSNIEERGLNEEVGELLEDMVAHGYQLIVPSEIRRRHDGAAGSYNVAVDTASYNPNDMKSFEAIMSHELVHSTQENQEFGPMPQEEKKWLNQRIQDYESLTENLPYIISFGDIEKATIGQAIQDRDKLHQSARYIHQIRKLREQRKNKIENSQGISRDSNIGLAYTPIYGIAEEENIQDIEVLEQKEGELQTELFETLNNYADSEKDRLGENSPVQNSQISQRLEKLSELNKSTERFYEEIPAYLTTFAYQNEPSLEVGEPDETIDTLHSHRQDYIDHITNFILEGVDDSTGEREVPSHIEDSARNASQEYLSNRTQMPAKSAAADISNDWLFLFQSAKKTS